MRNYDEKEVKELNAEQWQIDLLKLNPGYVYWGPHEDYMYNDGKGWDGRVIHETWKDFGPWELNELNERVNFYFSVNRKSEECKICGGNGYHSDAQEIVNTFYAHMNDSGIHWNDKITQDELDALIKHGRFKSGITVDEVNKKNKPGSRGIESHDAINRSILIEARLKRLGIKKLCDECNGNGFVYIEPKSHVSLTLWILHPRKGCSRGVEISNIEQSDLPEIFDWLRDAAKRNADRFLMIQNIS